MKKINLKRIASLAICISTLISFCGCGNKNAIDKNGNETLKWIFIGAGKLQDSEMVWDKFNEELKSYLPGLKIDFQSIASAEYAEKWKLMMASQEEVDIAWAGYIFDLTNEVKKQAYLPLDDLLDKYGQDIKNSMPQWCFEKAKVGGQLYFIPNYQMMADQMPVVMKTPKELSEQYLDKEAVLKSFSEDNKILTKEDFKPVEDYLEKLKQAGKLGKGVSPSFFSFFANRIGWPRDLQPIITSAPAYIKSESNDFKVYNTITDFPKNDEYLQMAREWYEKGYIRQDILGLQNRTADEGKKDGYVIWSHYDSFGLQESDSEKYGMEIDIVPLSNKIFANHTPPSTNTALTSNCRNPEKAMQLLNLINSEKGKSLYNMLVYGIEDVHYKKLDENRVEMILQDTAWSSKNRYGYQKWILGNTFNAYYSQFEKEGYNEWVKEVNETAVVSPLIGFSFDSSAVSNEISQYNAIKKEYADISTGALSNWKELVEERNKKLELAGCDKIIKEAQRQIDEWLENNK